MRPSAAPEVDPQLVAELLREPRWMYPWDLGPGVAAPLIAEVLPAIHETRLAMLRDPVQEALTRAGPEARVLDLACSEGWFGHRMLEMGASRVVGIDLRDVNVRRAQLVAQHFGIGEDRLELRVANVHDLDPEELGQFDVVLMLGLVYHLEDPTGAIRLARACTRRVCVIESQLTRQTDPVVWGYGPEDEKRQRASFAAFVEEDADFNPIASAERVLSLVPNGAAVEEMAYVAGFERVERVEPPPLAQEYYINGDRGQFVAWP